jgi:fermentation-respiration switch protein FrsA (DUF1100 family)
MNSLKIILLVLIFGYFGLAAFALLFANRLVFPAPPAGYQDGPDSLKFTYNEAGDAVTLFYLPNPRARFLIFYHHGNGEDLIGIRSRLEDLVKAGYAVLAWDYPGYGTSDGTPTEKSVLSIADTLWDALPERFGFAHHDTLLYGRSVGGGPAVWLASREKPAGLILEGTFTSIFRVGLPFNPLPWDIFDNLSRISEVACPILIFHGTADRTVPFSHGQQLYEAAPEPKFFSWIDGGGHNDLPETYPEIYHSSLEAFTSHLLDTRN